MEDRSALGAADVPDDVLASMVALDHGRSAPGSLVEARVAEVDYDLPAITTGGRHRVSGQVRYDDGLKPFSLFVKQIHAWERSPLFNELPEEIREFAAATVPWRTEALVYRSDLAAALPDGLRMPRAHGVFDLDEKSAAVWLEDLRVAEVTWDSDRFVRAARLLGRLAGSADVARFATIGEFDWTVNTYVEGRVRHQVVPLLHADPIWQHPLVAGAFDEELRERLLAAAEQVPAYTAELMAFPTTAGHGDACPNNLLVRSDDPDTFTLIDFGFWQELPVGYDLGQLLVGDVQIGKRGTEDLAGRGAACLDAYLAGLADEGFAISRADLLRAHALQLLIFTGISTVPLEHLGSPPSPELVALARGRAALSRYSLDLLDATSGG